jgi:hypothetical protein
MLRLVADDLAQRRLVVDDEQPTAPARRRRHRADRPRVAGVARPGEAHEERRSRPGRAPRDGDRPAVAGDDRVRDRQAEAGALARCLGREERLEKALAQLGSSSSTIRTLSDAALIRRTENGWLHGIDRVLPQR